MVWSKHLNLHSCVVKAACDCKSVHDTLMANEASGSLEGLVPVFLCVQKEPTCNTRSLFQ